MKETEQEIISTFQKWEEIDKMVKIYSDFTYGAWDKIMQVVKFIENIDHKGLHYEWEDFDEDGNKQTNYNFNGYSVDIEGNQCFIFLHLELDPGKTICSSTAETKFEAVLTACYEFAKFYNEDKL